MLIKLFEKYKWWSTLTVNDSKLLILDTDNWSFSQKYDGI